jgi:hypothetical protein
MISLIQRCCRNVQFYSAFFEGAQYDPNCAVVKTMLSFFAHFRQQHLGILHAFGENGEQPNLKKVVENVGYTMVSIDG